jgi:putative ABC transport system substrate-binding protein
MRRRKFLAVFGAAAAWPLSARAVESHPRIGILTINTAEYDAPYLAAFRDGLQRLGHVEGRNVTIDYRHSNGDASALSELASELIKLKPNVVLTNSISPARAVKRISPSLPIICPGFGDAFVPTLAASFAHPGGSVTGIASVVEGLIGKLTELTLDAIPKTTKIGFLSNPTGASTPTNEGQIRSSAQARGIEVQIERVEKREDFDSAFRRLSRENVQAVIAVSNGLINSELKHIVELQMTLRLPLVFAQRSGVDAGGLASYGVSASESYRRVATYADKIIKGAAPGDLPIEFPTKIELAINLKTAKALGLIVPPQLLDRADVVIE